MIVEKFNPFFCRYLKKGFIPLFSKVLISLFAGALFIIPRLSISSKTRDFVEDKSYLIGLIIVVAFLTLYYATYTLKELLHKMHSFLNVENPDEFFKKYIHSLRDIKFILFGIAFSILNTSIGIYLGIKDVGSVYFYVLIWGYFLAGFICGMAVLGIYTVLNLMHNYAKHEGLQLDYRSPDNCGGLQFIGNSVLKFCLVIILTGSLIAGYILFAPWQSDGIFRSIVKNFWIVFPFLAAITITFSPIHDFSKLLIAFKNTKDAEFSNEILNLDALRTEENPEELKEINDKIDRLEEERTKVFKMNTIPLKKGSKMWFIMGNVASLIPGGMKIFDFIDGIK